MKSLVVIVAASVLLIGCATVDTTNWTQADWDNYNQMLARNDAAMKQLSQNLKSLNAQLNQNTQASLAQSAAYRAPEIQQIRQPDGTTWVYCRGVTDALYVCRTY